MIVLDTNDLSELVRPTPEPKVIEWIASKPRSSLFTSTITRGEIFYGLSLMSEGRRRDGLFDAFRTIATPQTVMPRSSQHDDRQDDRSVSSVPWWRLWHVRGGQAWRQISPW